MKFSDLDKEFEFLDLNHKKKKIVTPYKNKMFCDGGSRNGRDAAIGIIVYDDKDNIVVSHREWIGTASCNVAEYIALYTGLMLLKEQGIKEVNIYMDSDLVVQQVNGSWKCKHEHMIKLCSKVKSLLTGFKWTLSWISRSKNQEADRLVNQAFKDKE
jgi:ribonuclease HI